MREYVASSDIFLPLYLLHCAWLHAIIARCSSPICHAVESRSGEDARRGKTNTGVMSMSFLSKLFRQSQTQDPKTPPPRQPNALEPPLSPAAKDCSDNESMIGGRFEILETQVGGMGIVHFCLDHQEGIPVALKTFKQEYLPDRAARDRFLREGTIWVDLGRHPHIVRCRQVFAPGIGPEVYLVLDLIAPAEGKADASLRAWLQPRQPLPIQEALLFALHIARGMKHATEKVPGLVHRDLKPENVLVGQDRIARVTDFGLATMLAGLDEKAIGAFGPGTALIRTRLTRGFVGTPLYMAPEQWQPGEVLDARADIYALGCILYEMLTGDLMVSGRDLAELENAHRSGDIKEIPRSVPQEMANLVRKCVVTDREKRYQNWEQLETALRKAHRVLVGKEVPEQLVAGSETREERVAMAWAYQTIGASYLTIGKYDVAQKYFEKGVRTGREENHLWLEGLGLRNLGIVYLRKGEAQRAMEFLEEALSIARRIGWTEEGAILTQLGNAQRDVGNTQQALRYYDQALAFLQAIGDMPNVGAVLNSMGNLKRRSGQLQEAIDLYGRALSTMEDVGDRTVEGTVLGNLGICYRLLENTKLAIDFLERALALARETGDLPGEGRALSNLGNVYRDLRDYQRARKLTEQSLVIARRVGDRRHEGTALGNLALDCLLAEDYQQAIEHSKQAIAFAQEMGDVPGLARASMTLARGLGESNKPSEALQHAQIALQAFDQIGNKQSAERARELIDQLRNHVARTEHWDRGIAYSNQERWEEAIREYRAALRLDTDNAALHFNLGMAYWSKGQSKEAIVELETTLRLAPSFEEARVALSSMHSELASEHRRRGHLQDAAREYRAATHVEPSGAVAHLDLGTTLAQLGDLQEAIREYHAAIRLDPDSAKAHDGLGVVLLQLGRPAEAMREFERAVEIDPGYLGARLNRGAAYAQQGRLNEAIGEFRAALRLDPADPDVRFNLGLAYMQQGRLDEAIAELEAALRLAPDSAGVHYSLGLLYRDQGLHREAVSEFRSALRIDPTLNDARLNLAGYYMQQGRLDDAIREYHTVLTVDPNCVEVHHNLGLAYYNQGRVADAIPEFRIAANSGFEPAARALAQLGVW